MMTIRKDMVLRHYWCGGSTDVIVTSVNGPYIYVKPVGNPEKKAYRVSIAFLHAIEEGKVVPMTREQEVQSRRPSINRDSTRERLIEWLCWNDKNGCYSDKDSTLEGKPSMTRLEALTACEDLGAFE